MWLLYIDIRTLKKIFKELFLKMIQTCCFWHVYLLFAPQFVNDSEWSSNIEYMFWIIEFGGQISLFEKFHHILELTLELMNKEINISTTNSKVKKVRKHFEKEISWETKEFHIGFFVPNLQLHLSFKIYAILSKQFSQILFYIIVFNSFCGYAIVIIVICKSCECHACSLKYTMFSLFKLMVLSLILFIITSAPFGTLVFGFELFFLPLPWCWHVCDQ